MRLEGQHIHFQTPEETLCSKNLGSPHATASISAALMCAQSDAFYVPAKGRMTFAVGAAAFEDSGLSHEVVVPNLLGMITDDQGRVDRFRAEYMLEPGERVYESQHMEEYFISSGIKNGAFMLHPMKISQKNASAHFWQWYAQKYSC